MFLLNTWDRHALGCSLVGLRLRAPKLECSVQARSGHMGLWIRGDAVTLNRDPGKYPKCRSPDSTPLSNQELLFIGTALTYLDPSRGLGTLNLTPESLNESVPSEAATLSIPKATGGVPAGWSDVFGLGFRVYVPQQCPFALFLVGFPD